MISVIDAYKPQVGRKDCIQTKRTATAYAIIHGMSAASSVIGVYCIPEKKYIFLKSLGTRNFVKVIEFTRAKGYIFRGSHLQEGSKRVRFSRIIWKFLRTIGKPLRTIWKLLRTI